MNNPTAKQYLKEALNQEFIRRNKFPLEEDEWIEFCKDFSFLFRVMDEYKNLQPNGSKQQHKSRSKSKNKRYHKRRSSDGPGERNVGGKAL